MTYSFTYDMHWFTLSDDSGKPEVFVLECDDCNGCGAEEVASAAEQKTQNATDISAAIEALRNLGCTDFQRWE